nr:magnesium chelatase [Saccharofermentans sp.]
MSTKYSITTVFSSFMYGIVAIPVQIEVYLTPGINTFDILGLCDSSIMESRGRIRAALVASG